MGKAVSKSIKKHCQALLEKFPEKFSSDFEKNKLIINELNLPFFKTERNLMAGYLTRIKKQKK